MDHLSAGIGLLHVIGDCNGVELSDSVVAFQDHTWIFPGDGGSRFDLRPGNLGTVTKANATFGDEIVDSTFTILVAGIPVLYSTVFDIGIGMRNDFHYRGVQLIFVAHRRSTTLQVTHCGTFVGNNEGTLKLTSTRAVDAEVGTEFHRTTHTFRYVTE